ncbi:hypothetical protein [Campylobacter troglodytis]|uniref:hypothetical protein n=1 Tax=Campylobacter troglodytis TaxID=654363 RepID=UPI00115BAEB7|nr:hypothetical protein [Campylobacter troglodytis]
MNFYRLQRSFLQKLLAMTKFCQKIHATCGKCVNFFSWILRTRYARLRMTTRRVCFGFYFVLRVC